MKARVKKLEMVFVWMCCIALFNVSERRKRTIGRGLGAWRLLSVRRSDHVARMLQLVRMTEDQFRILLELCTCKAGVANLSSRHVITVDVKLAVWG